MASAAETEITELISKWEQAVRDEDVAGIRANHSEDFMNVRRAHAVLILRA
jgi:ketosteroid isomerase-like protein